MKDEHNKDETCLERLQVVVMHLRTKVLEIEARLKKLETERDEVIGRRLALEGRNDNGRTLNERLQLEQLTSTLREERYDVFSLREHAVAEYQIALSAFNHAVERARELDLPVPELG